ncbi:ATP-binding protein [Sulfurospirillum oryzae]|uniref:ATP-binding protein n=1 Tax=Sulfurospirillum oryzae TaxID=2976535 RepID=UPI0021E885A5|nr:ATP-binding protein [Sulfurospirillum oryzae]
MKNVVGQAVRGKDFWDRKSELAKIWQAIENGTHPLLVAPRRVGKTSIMYKILDEPKDDYAVVYVNTESADSENDFWHKLFNALMDEEFKNKNKLVLKSFYARIKTISIKKISTSGIEFDDGKVLDYAEAFEELIKEIDSDKKLIIMMDEFAQTIENIIKYASIREAESLLKTHRSLRQNPKITSKVTFVYAGSIGLESVVAKLDAMKFINDLNSIKVTPLSKDEAAEFAHSLNTLIKSDEIFYLLERIEWLIPFYIQLIIQEIHAICLEKSLHVISKETVDQAIEHALDHRNHFEHWLARIKSAFEKDEFKFAKEILNLLSDQGTLESKEISNLADKYGLEHEVAKEIIHALVYDGYINNNENPKIYRFNSPILKLWWYKNVAN